VTERRRVLVSAPDRAMRSAVRRALDRFAVVEAADEVTTSALAVACRPDVIVVDATDAARAGRALAGVRNDFRTVLTTTVYIVDRLPVDGGVNGAFGGADDYVVCPFADEELAARVDVSVRRSESRRGVNPLTGLPGNTVVREEIARRAASGEPFAFLYVDLDDFKALNDRFGFARGDDVIRTVAGSIVRALETVSGPGCFAGHVGGDDFVVLAPPEDAEDVAAGIIRCFDAELTGCTMSIGVVSSGGGAEDPLRLTERAAAAKAAAKRRAGSSWDGGTAR